MVNEFNQSQKKKTKAKTKTKNKQTNKAKKKRKKRKKQRKQNIENKEEEKPFMNSNHLTQEKRHMSMYIQDLGKNWHVCCGVKPITESLRKV
jgi:hypothetical protein